MHAERIDPPLGGLHALEPSRRRRGGSHCAWIGKIDRGADGLNALSHRICRAAIAGWWACQWSAPYGLHAIQKNGGTRHFGELLRGSCEQSFVLPRAMIARSRRTCRSSCGDRRSECRSAALSSRGHRRRAGSAMCEYGTPSSGLHRVETRCLAGKADTRNGDFEAVTGQCNERPRASGAGRAASNGERCACRVGVDRDHDRSRRR